MTTFRPKTSRVADFDIVIAYEKGCCHIKKLTEIELLKLSLEGKGTTQRQLASGIGVICSE